MYRDDLAAAHERIQAQEVEIEALKAALIQYTLAPRLRDSWPNLHHLLVIFVAVIDRVLGLIVWSAAKRLSSVEYNQLDVHTEDIEPALEADTSSVASVETMDFYNPCACEGCDDFVEPTHIPLPPVEMWR